jgi:TrmH family RNA methyltransferase
MLHAFRLSAYYFRNEGRLMITRIESRHNTTLRHLARLAREKKYRQGAGEMVCEGEKMLYEALSSGIAVKSILLRAGDTQNEELITRAEAQGARLFEAEPQVFALASDVETPQGVIFSCAMPKRFADDLPEALSGAVLLDGVQDPGNLGTILRTADAFALDAVILCEGCTDPTAPKVVRATMGAAFRQPVYHMPLAEAIAALKTRGLPVYAAALEPDSVRSTTLDLHGAAVIIGSEGRGVTRQALELCDRKMVIPMAGRAESLNAGVAASILIWEMTR